MFAKRSWLIGLCMVVAAFALACGGGDSEEEGARDAASPGGLSAGAISATQAPAAQIRRGGTMLVALEQNPQRFDPKVYTDVYSGEVVGNVFDTLIRHEENLTPKGYLAEKIDQPDNLTYIFTLRQGVKFHDGTELDAEAVKFSIDRIREYKAGPSYSDSQYIADTVVTDKYTLRLTLNEPFAPFLSILAGRIGTVVSPTAVRTMGEEAFALKPVGSGPFKFVEWKTDSFVKVTKNENYWRQGVDAKPMPYLDAVEWRIITEPATRLTALQTGDVHIAPVRDADLKIVKDDKNLTWKQQAAFGWSGLLPTATKPPFDNKFLRLAVASAIDRDELVRSIYEGNAVPSTGPIGPAMEWARDAGYKPYDAAKVKEYLTQGGRPNGFEFTGWFSAGSSQTEQLAQLIQSQLAKHGITMKVEFADFNGVVIPKSKAQEPGTFAIGLNCGPDPDQCAANRFITGGGFNYTGYNNPRVDELVKAERSTTNREERARIFKELGKLLSEEAASIFTIHGVSRFTGSTKVQNWFIGYKYTQGFSEYWLSQ